MESPPQFLQFKLFNETQALELSFASITQTPSYGEKFLQCPFPKCVKIFHYKSERDWHLTNHSDAKPWACTRPSCTKAFKRRDALRVHMQSHSQKVQLFCNIPECTAQFMSSPALRYHVDRHYSLSEVRLNLRNQRLFQAKSDLNGRFNSSFIDQKQHRNDDFSSSIKTLGSYKEDWSPQPVKILCIEERKREFSFVEKTSEFSKWLKTEFAHEEKDYNGSSEDMNAVSL